MTASSDTVLLACTLSRWQGDPRRCRWCNVRLPFHRKRWCSQICVEEYKAQHWWPEARVAAIRRDRRRCQDCVADPAQKPGFTEVHHIVPVLGVRTASCLHHVSGLVTLCQHHHGLRHRAAA